MSSQPIEPRSKASSLVSSLRPEQLRATLDRLTESELEALHFNWDFWATDKQRLPPGNWAYWLIKAGRGFGKTRTGAETVRQWARTNSYVNLIGATADDARDIMIEGESGIMAICPRGERPLYLRADRQLRWPNGSKSLIFTADEPERLRGKQHMKLWCDELAAWRYVDDAWTQAKFGLRLGKHPQAIITTTPKPLPIIKALISDPACVVTHGSTYENRANLAPSFFADIIRTYEGTRIGRQELLAEILDDTPGALWSQAMVELAQCSLRDVRPLIRVVVAVDPAVTANEGSDETGIVVAGVSSEKVWVLEDGSIKASPGEWAAAVVRLAKKWNADRIIAEVNNGGDLVERNIRMAEGGANLPFRAVRASRGKAMRAEPVAALYERNLVAHVRQVDNPTALNQLEDQMMSFVPGITGKSPDRLDALVWAITDLVIDPLIVHSPYQLGEWQSISAV
jgi:phage terminase large subunit-like protein